MAKLIQKQDRGVDICGNSLRSNFLPPDHQPMSTMQQYRSVSDDHKVRVYSGEVVTVSLPGGKVATTPEGMEKLCSKERCTANVRTYPALENDYEKSRSHGIGTEALRARPFYKDYRHYSRWGAGLGL